MSLDSNLGSSDCLELKQNVAPLLGHLVADGGRGRGAGVNNQMPAMVVGFWLLNSLRRPNRKTISDSLL